MVNINPKTKLGFLRRNLAFPGLNMRFWREGGVMPYIPNVVEYLLNKVDA
jgi:hypothetical protein